MGTSERQQWAAERVVHMFTQVHGLTEAHLKMVAAEVRVWHIVERVTHDQGGVAKWPPASVPGAHKVGAERQSEAERTLELLAPQVAAAVTAARGHLTTFPKVGRPGTDVPPEVLEWAAAGQELADEARRSLRTWLGLEPA